MLETKSHRIDQAARQVAINRLAAAAAELMRLQRGNEWPEDYSPGRLDLAERELIDAAVALSTCAGKPPLVTGVDPGAFLRYLRVDREGHVILADSDVERIAAACLAAFKAERRG